MKVVRHQRSGTHSQILVHAQIRAATHGIFSGDARDRRDRFLRSNSARGGIGPQTSSLPTGRQAFGNRIMVSLNAMAEKKIVVLENLKACDLAVSSAKSKMFLSAFSVTQR